MFRESSPKAARRVASGPPLLRRTVTEEVLERLRDLLLRGELRPGSRIDQAELAAGFGVSTVPVREALLRLQSAGLVEVIPHRGVFVAEVSVEELLDIYTTRELLEEQAARLAAAHLTDADVETLARLANSMQTAAGKGQLDDLLSLNREFHFTIYRAAKRRHLLQLIEQLWDLSTRYAHLQLHAVPDRASEALYEIRSIVSACERKDTDALGWMIRYKVHQTTAGLLQHMSLPDTNSASAESALKPAKKVGKRSSEKKQGTAQAGSAVGRAKSGKVAKAAVASRKTPKASSLKKLTREQKKTSSSTEVRASTRRRSTKVGRGA